MTQVLRPTTVRWKVVHVAIIRCTHAFLFGRQQPMIPNLESKLKTKSTTQILSLPTMSMLWSLAMHIGDSFLLHPSSLQNPTIILFFARHATTGSSLRREHYANTDPFSAPPSIHPPRLMSSKATPPSLPFPFPISAQANQTNRM
jgi:hypothetical protein